MRVVVHSDVIQDRDGARLVLDKKRRCFGGKGAAAYGDCQAERRLLPRRWVVERTISSFGRNRRLAKDVENFAKTLATFAILASIQLAPRRLARALVANSTNRPSAKYDDKGRQIGW